MQVSVSETVPVALGVGGMSSGTINSHFLPSALRSACPQMWGSQYRPGRLAVLLEAATSHRVISHRGQRCDGARALGEVGPAF